VEECRDRIEDAVFAVQGALEQGFVTGGGAALLHASQSLDKLLQKDGEDEDFKFGVRVTRKACEAPFRQIMSNAQGSGDSAPYLIE